MKKATKEEAELVRGLKNQDLGVLVRFLVETREHMKRQTGAMERIAVALERRRRE